MATTNQVQPINTRKRISVACNGCRAKRTKCDGRQPQCSACSYRAQSCEYTQEESNRKRPSNAYIQALEARVVTLEQKLADQAKSGGASCAHEGHCCELETAVLSETSVSDVVSPSDPEEIDGDDMDELTDALGCFTLGEAGELRFYGASSNFTVVQNHSMKIPSSVDAKNRGIAVARAKPEYFEPSDELRDHLLEIFWKWQNTWQYLVPRESFVRDLYVEKTGRYCTPLLLNAILALSSRYSPRLELRGDPGDPNTAGEAFATQAKMMLHYEYDAPTTTTAQATALLGLFWAAVDNEGLGFMYIGMASRMVMNLGLHSDCSSYVAKGLLTEDDIEDRNITFWGIYVLDKLYCLGMGRPASIREYNITTTKMKPRFRRVSNLSEFQERVSNPFPTSHIIENVLYFCDLLLATSEVIDELYAQRSSWTEKEREDRVMQSHLRAARLFNRLPKTLKISNSSLQPAPPYVYQLHLQYHQSILLLHRPFFKLLYPGKHSIDYDPQGRDIHSRSCRDSAIKVSRILQIYKNNYTHRYIPISAVHPVFTASIVLLLHVKSEGSAGRSEAMRCLSICIRSLYEMNSNWDWASRSIRAIQSLATQWNIDIWAYGLRDEISEEHWLNFERYERGCLLISQWPATQNNTGVEEGQSSDVLGDLLDAWTYDQGLVNLPFNILDEL